MEKLRLAFICPPHADWNTPANLTWMMLESHYKHESIHYDKVEFIEAPFAFDIYSSWQEIKDEMDGGKPADVYCFSSYVWNYSMCDEVCRLVREQNPNAITIIGGPHIGENEPKTIETRLELYDYICKPTKPGEIFFQSLLDQYFNHLNTWPKPEDVEWEFRSNKNGRVLNLELQDYSVYEEHLPYLKKMRQHARDRVLEPFMAIESTRGCPYKCSFCEWGGGIGGKVYKKSLDVFKRDVTALREAGYRDAYLTDANFGAFKDRDIEIFRWSFNEGFNLTDISTFKARDLQRRIDLVDAWFDVVGTGAETHSEVYVPEQGSDALFFLGGSGGEGDIFKTLNKNKDGSIVVHEQHVSRGGHFSDDGDIHSGREDENDPLQKAIADGDVIYVSVVPTVSIQSASDQAMKDANRVDLNLEDKIKLSEHIDQRCNIEGYPRPPVEMILGMPGSTIEDFYAEYEIYWNFKSLGSWRHDYMFLPDSELTKPEYIEKYKIETVEVYTDVIEEGGAKNRHSMYRNMTTVFRTIVSCYSYTREEFYEMWFMNICGNILLQNHYHMFEHQISPAQFCKNAYKIAQKHPEFPAIYDAIVDILSPETPTRSLKKIGDESRLDAVMGMFTGDESETMFINEMFMLAYEAA